MKNSINKTIILALMATLSQQALAMFNGPASPAAAKAKS